MQALKLTLTQAVNQDSPIWNQFPMLGLGYMAAYLEKYLGFQNTEIVTSGEAEDILAGRPDIVGISSVTQNFNLAVALAEKVKAELGAKVIIGGHHITNLPHTLPECFDLAVMGEGEETLRELLRLYLEEGAWLEADLEGIPGIAFRNSRGEVSVTEPRALISPLDRIPHPDWKKLGVRPRDAVYMFSSRGCPYKCVFCSSTRYWQRFRAFSAEYVVGEIQELIRHYGVNFIYFYDDLFIADRNRLKQIVDLVVEDGIHRTVSFGGSVRANLVTEETCRLMKTMGFKQINFGAESGSDRVLAYLKGNVKVADNQRAIDLARQEGIEVSCSFILGTPTETKEEALDTYRFILRNRFNLSSFDTHLMTAWPGTPIWDSAVQRGLVSEKMRWADLVRYPTEDDPEHYILLDDQMTHADLMEVLRFMGSLRELIDWKTRALTAENQFSGLRTLEARLHKNKRLLPVRALLFIKEIIKKFVTL